MNGQLAVDSLKFHFSEYFSCTFAFGEEDLTLEGGEMGDLTLNKVPLKESGLFCPGKTTITAKYLVLEPTGARLRMTMNRHVI